MRYFSFFHFSLQSRSQRSFTEVKQRKSSDIYYSFRKLKISVEYRASVRRINNLSIDLSIDDTYRVVILYLLDSPTPCWKNFGLFFHAMNAK